MRPTVLGLSLSAVLWTYVLFPLVTVLRALVRPRPHLVADGELSATLIIAAHNEQDQIGSKLRNVLALDAQSGRLDVVVAADGCDDGTEGVVQQFTEAGIRLVSLPRMGKAAALNAAVATCTTDVLVFTDANSMLAPDAVRQLLRPFADPDVGGVAGDQRYLPVDGGTGSGERTYWSLDRILKSAESRGGSVVSATGALYAVRRELFRPVAEGVTDDFFVSTGVVAQGYRLVFEPAAKVYEPVSESDGAEYARKVRVMTRGLNGVLVRRELLDPREHGFYAVQLMSHKVLRRLMALPLAGLFVATTLKRPRTGALRVAVLAQGLLYATGGAGLMLGKRERQPKSLALPAYFCMVNAASVRAVWNLAAGRQITAWEPQRADGSRRHD